MKKMLCNLLIILGLFIIVGCKSKKEFDILKGKWKALPENQNVYIDKGGKENYYLECDGKGYYDLTTKSEDLANANYTISNTKVTFYDEGKQVLAICKINDNELDCLEKSYYAFKYVKLEK